jgi:hypothetical protein
MFSRLIALILLNQTNGIWEKLIKNKTTSLKYLLTVSDIFYMFKIIVIILKVSSSWVYPQVTLVLRLAEKHQIPIS